MRLLDSYFGDKELRTIYYRIDYEKFKFDDSFSGSEEEPYVDRLIYFFDTVGWLVKKGRLTMDEVSLIAYQAQRVLRNPEIQRYLEWLDGEHRNDGRPIPAHRDARELAEAISRSMRSPRRHNGEGHTDIAALSAAVVAVAVSMLVVPGPFEIVGAAVAVTLACVIAGYVWRNVRATSLQSLAIAAVFGMIAIPIVGFVGELWVAHDKWSLVARGEPLNCQVGMEWKPCNPPQSGVNNLWLIGTWIIIGGLVFMADRRQQQRPQ
jgi:hypothetical protein